MIKDIVVVTIKVNLIFRLFKVIVGIAVELTSLLHISSQGEGIRGGRPQLYTMGKEKKG
jgi:hypothetical protein